MATTEQRMEVSQWSTSSQGLTNDALAALYERHARSLLVFLTRRTFDAEVALDLLGETFAQAVLSRRRFRGADEATAKAWLFGIARNQLARYFKRGAVERRALQRLRLEPPSAPEAELARVEETAGLGELRAALREELSALSADHREAIRLRVLEELPYPQIAGRLGVSEQTVRARVSRGLRALAASLDRAALEEVSGA
jgi:RNA polymerase sigma-70 factor (ECF subfamily)